MIQRWDDALMDARDGRYLRLRGIARRGFAEFLSLPGAAAFGNAIACHMARDSATLAEIGAACKAGGEPPAALIRLLDGRLASIDVPFGRLAPLLRSVAAANFVVTDTYHLAVVAWALGVPAIVLAGDYHQGERAGKQVDLRVRHDKRKVLLAQDGLLDFFVEPALIADPTGRAAVVERLAATMADPECGPSARQRLAERAASSEAALSKAIAQSQTS